MPRSVFLSAVLLGMSATLANAGLKEAADDVLSGDPAVAARAVETLRNAGPDGLDALFEAHKPTLAAGPGAAGAPNDRWQRVKAAIDAVGAQRDCDVSRLYWHTDLPTALAAAEKQRKPVLSLRLLGKLTDEFSCANSRFFRTALYANKQVSDYLRQHFVLHWQSVRPVPRVTIDFGDGRKLERTLTGNSIHYVLDADGRPCDALPGLYGPGAFLRELQAIEKQIAARTGQSEPARNLMALRYHQQRIQTIRAQWERDLQTLQVSIPTPARPGQPAQAAATVVNATNAGTATPVAGQGGAARFPRATAAGVLARPKGGAEFPILRALALHSIEALQAATTVDVWQQLGVLHADDAALDVASIGLIRRQNPGLDDAATAELPQQDDLPGEETQLAAMVRTFEAAMAADTVRNEFELRRTIHQWLTVGQPPELDALNDRVYAELFLTPRADPWLGLSSPETYTALENR
jgi:hypothetical protein